MPVFVYSNLQPDIVCVLQGLRYSDLLLSPYGITPEIVAGLSTPQARVQYDARQDGPRDLSGLMDQLPDIGNAAAMAIFAHLTKWQCSIAQSDELLHILRDSQDEPPCFESFSMRGCNAAMDAWEQADGRGRVEQVDLGEDCDGEQDMTLYMRSASLAVMDLLRDPEFATRMTWGHDLLVNSRGERVFSSASSGVWWEMAVDRHEAHQYVVGVILSPDAMVVTKKKIAHGVYITLNNIPEDQRCSSRAYVLVGLIPIWSRAKSIYAAETDKNSCLAKRRLRQVHSKSLHYILRSLTVAAQDGGMDVVCGDGELRCVVPLLCTIATDIPEGQTITFGRPLECFSCNSSRHSRTHAVGAQYAAKHVVDVKAQVMHALRTGEYGDASVWGSMYESENPRAKPFCMMEDGVVQVCVKHHHKSTNLITIMYCHHTSLTLFQSHNVKK